MERVGLDEEGMPIREGVYLIKRDGETEEIDVYHHPDKGLCCFSEDLGHGGSGVVDDEDGYHIPIGNTGLEFIIRVRDLRLT